MLRIIFLFHKIEKQEKNLFYTLLNKIIRNVVFNYQFFIHEYHGEKFVLVIPSWDLKE